MLQWVTSGRSVGNGKLTFCPAMTVRECAQECTPNSPMVSYAMPCGHGDSQHCAMPSDSMTRLAGHQVEQRQDFMGIFANVVYCYYNQKFPCHQRERVSTWNRHDDCGWQSAPWRRSLTNDTADWTPRRDATRAGSAGE